MILLLGVAVTFAAREPSDYRQILVDRAIARFHHVKMERGIETALDFGDSFAQQVIGSARLYYEFGLACNQENFTIKAMGYYNKAIKNQPDMVEALYDRAELFIVDEKLDEAKEDLHKASTAKHWAVHFRLAEIAAREKNLQDFENQLTESIRYGFSLENLLNLGQHWRFWAKDPTLGRILRRVILLYGSEEIWLELSQ